MKKGLTLLRRVGGSVWILFLFLCTIYWLSGGAFDKLKNSNEGYLILVAKYFKNADTLNYIMDAIIFGTSMALFLLLNLMVDKLYKKLANKYSKLQFLNTKWADVLLQNTAAFAILVLLFVIGSNIYISVRGSQLKAESINDILPAPAFILGTSKYLSSGKGENLYYRYRINAALELWAKGKVKYFILSGDGVGEAHKEAYDETKDMKEDLIAAGVPADKIKVDPFGFRTLDSILRLRGIFHLNEIIIVSQDFHTPRALVLCEYYGIEAIGYDAKGSATWAMIKKEFLESRPNLIMDILVANTQPKVTNEDGSAIVYREEFDATKSNLHVLIVLGVLVLVFISPFALGVYRSKQGEERVKAAKKYAIIGLCISTTLVVMVIQVYKNLDIKFIDELVETTASVVGVETKKMEVKREIVEKIKEKQNPEPTERVNQVDSVAQSKEEAELRIEERAIKSKKELTEGLITQGEKLSITEKAPDKPAEETKEEEEQEDDGLIIAKSTGTTTKVAKSENKTSSGPLHFFTAKVHGNHILKNEQSIPFRITENFTYKSQTFEENKIFYAKVNVFDGTTFFKVDRIDDTPVKIEGFNQEEKTKGFSIDNFFKNAKGEIVLSDGLDFTFSY